MKLILFAAADILDIVQPSSSMIPRYIEKLEDAGGDGLLICGIFPPPVDYKLPIVALVPACRTQNTDVLSTVIIIKLLLKWRSMLLKKGTEKSLLSVIWQRLSLHAGKELTDLQRR